MKWLTLEGIKAQCRIEQDFHEEDDLLVENGEGAEEAILNVCNRTYEDLIETYGKVPVSLVHASKMLVDSLYKDREKDLVHEVHSNPSFDILVKPYMKL